MTNRRGFSPLAVVLGVCVLAVAIGGALYLYNSRSAPTPQQPTPGPQPPTPQPTTPFRATSVVEANNRFAFDLYSKYAASKNTNENIFFSPFSISSAIAMTYEGAKGKTADEMATVFHFPTSTQELRSEYQNIYNTINVGSDSYKLNTANALWVQKDFQLFTSYADAIKTYYDGTATNLDFKKDSVGAAGTVNGWVEDKTAHKIKNLLSPSDIPPLTKLILTNAIYFKGEWSEKFQKQATQDKKFTPSDGSAYNVPMMEQTAWFQHADLGDVQLLELSYKGSPVSMLVILPKDNNLASIERGITAEQVTGWSAKLENHRVDVSLPKFKIETKEHMAADLKQLGMPTAFVGGIADFSGIAPVKDITDKLYIADVIHQTFVANDEDGTEAAAATAVMMEAGNAAPSKPPKLYVFNANHPFIFLLRENRTGAILFTGRVAKP